MKADEVRLTELSHCAGWAAKLSLEDLVEILKNVPVLQHPNLLVGTETGDDAAVYKINDETALILTVDFFPPIVDDPYDYGQIAVANSLSDVYSMGGKPILGLNIVGFPVTLDNQILTDVLRGGYDKAGEANVVIAGGHTVDDPEPKYGPVSYTHLTLPPIYSV